MRWFDECDPVIASEILLRGEKVSFYRPTLVGGSFSSGVTKAPDILMTVFKHAIVNLESSSVLDEDGTLYMERAPSERDIGGLQNYAAGHVIAHGKFSALVNLRDVEPIREGIFFGGNGSFNYYHWMLEILPRSIFLDRIPREFAHLPILVSDIVSKQPALMESFELLCPDREILVLDRKKNYKVETLIHLNSPSIIPFNLIGRSQYRAHYTHLSSKAIEHMRRVFINKSKSAQAVSEQEFPRKVFLSRKPGKRNYNQQEIELGFKRIGFVPIYIEEYGFLEQVAIMNNAEWIAGPTGAAWTNLMFCEPGTKAVCWMADKYKDFSAYSTLAQINGVKLVYALYETEAQSTGDLYLKDYHIGWPAIEAAIKRLESGS
jgi:capsular polysaccharide biosynthesis protein